MLIHGCEQYINFVYHDDSDDFLLLAQKKSLLAKFLALDLEGAEDLVENLDVLGRHSK